MLGKQVLIQNDKPSGLNALFIMSPGWDETCSELEGQNGMAVEVVIGICKGLVQIEIQNTNWEKITYSFLSIQFFPLFRLKKQFALLQLQNQYADLQAIESIE